MGGQTSRMVRELVSDSMYIIRQTDRAAYERSAAARREVQHKLDELRALNQDTLQSPEAESQRSETFRTLETSVTAHKQQLDHVADEFAKQFELPKGYQKIADHHRAERAEAAKKAKDAAED